MEKLGAWYNKLYATDALGNRAIRKDRWPRDRFEMAVHAAGSGERVLDVGCGNGLVLFNLSKEFRELHGIELSTNRVEVARESLAGLPATISMQDIERGLDYAAGFFDTVICNDVIEHVIDASATVAEIHRVLQPGGRLVMITPNVARLDHRIRMLRGRFPTTSSHAAVARGELLDGGHVHYFTFGSLEHLLEVHGFAIQRRYGFGRQGKLLDVWPTLLSRGCAVLAVRR